MESLVRLSSPIYTLCTLGKSPGGNKLGVATIRKNIVLGANNGVGNHKAIIVTVIIRVVTSKKDNTNKII